MSAPVAADADAASAASPAISPALDFAAGTVAGVASLLTGHPFDTVKVRLQTQAPTGSIAWSNRSSNAEKATTTAAAATTTTSRATLPPRGRHAVTAAATAAAARARRQAAPPAKAQGKYYRNAVHAFVRVTKEEGVAGLYKGVTSPMLGVALMNASVFTSYKYTMNALLSRDARARDCAGDGGPDPEPTLLQITAAGSASGVFTSLITTPIDRLKILQQSLPAPAPSPSSPASPTALPRTAPPLSRSLVPPRPQTPALASARPPPAAPSLGTLLRTMSLRSLYRGWSVTILRDVGYGPYFLVYEYVVRGGNFGLFSTSSSPSARTPRSHACADLREEIDAELWGASSSTTTMERDDGRGGDSSSAAGAGGASTARILMAGGLAGIVGWGCTFPIDVIKTKIQSVPPASLYSAGGPTLGTEPPVPRLPSTAGSKSLRSVGSTPPRQPHRYASIASTVVATLQESGWRGFVAGLGPTLLRSIPVNMVTFAVFELVVSTFR